MALFQEKNLEKVWSGLLREQAVRERSNAFFVMLTQLFGNSLGFE